MLSLRVRRLHVRSEIRSPRPVLFPSDQPKYQNHLKQRL